MRHLALSLLLLAGLITGGCATVSGPAKGPEPAPGSGIPAASEPDRVTYMFVQEAAGGTLMPEGEGAYRLTLNEVIPYTVYFSDRPYRIAGNAPMKGFIDRFCWDPGNPPNAALVLKEADASEDILVAQILSPEYDAAAATLSYTLRPLKEYKGKGLAYYHAGRDESVPQSFGAASLFIDNCADKTGFCWAVPESADCTCTEKEMGPMSYGTCWSWGSGCNPCHDQNTYRRECDDIYGARIRGNCRCVWIMSFRDKDGKEISK
ncbi:MAG: hypothetical protein JW821_19180 [Deltaproteobacteria bacterium]|nr:hypothetical protein [Deltaproteobacteria bacterium]